ncbi:MAG: hypothetical protein K6U88_05690, partial [Dehalococcoidia bacterium]|nr:hypothetical protein [Dehalococcoidia bacterium]
MMRRTPLLLVGAACGLVAGMVLAGRTQTGSDVVALPGTPAAAPAPPAAAATAAPPQGAQAGVPDFTEVASRAVPAVTNISSIQIVRTPNSPFAGDPFFRYFFGDEDMFGYRERRGESAGSGVIVSPDGYVLSFEEIFRKIDETIEVGGEQLLLQGGHNPDLPLEWFVDMFRAVKQRYPGFRLHALSPPEIVHLSRLSR